MDHIVHIRDIQIDMSETDDTNGINETNEIDYIDSLYWAVGFMQEINPSSLHHHAMFFRDTTSCEKVGSWDELSGKGGRICSRRNVRYG